ncbi:UNVERIFIED_CONTAM: U-box domain-containing protein 52 [Sesamum indicum]
MWPPQPNSGERMPPMTRLVAVAIDKDKGSQVALKWAVENLLGKGQTVILVHVKLRHSMTGLTTSPSLPGSCNHVALFYVFLCMLCGLSPPFFSSFAQANNSCNCHSAEHVDSVPFFRTGPSNNSDITDEIGDDAQLKELFLPFRVYCTRKDIQCYDVVLDDTDVARSLIEFVKQSAIDMLVVGATAKGSIFRFKMKDIAGTVLKGVPDFCTVYVIHKGKISSTKAACRPAPSILSPLRNQIMLQANSKYNGMDQSMGSSANSRSSVTGHSRPGSEPSPRARQNDSNFIKSPFTHRRAPNGKAYELSTPETDISFVSSGRRSVDVYPTYSESFEGSLTPPRLSGFSDVDSQGYDSWTTGRRSLDILPLDLAASPEPDKAFSGQTMDEVEAEMRRLKQELKQTMDMYSTACKEALSAREKAKELQRWKMEEQKRLEEARLAEEAALALAEKEKAKSRAALEHAEAAQRIAELEAQKRINAEMKALKEAEEKTRVLSSLSQPDCRYRKYTIEEIEVATEYFAQSRKIGEGGYGPVYKCYLDHTPVAVKVLRPDATHGRSQFQQEVEILSCIRHPNMVLLLGACPEYGCLVYEYMSNGSLEDCLVQRGKTPPLSWQHRFRIAAEIGTGLLFLHQTKPEPLVHRDLKPANILLDRNYVSKISDVGLARLVPPSVADNVTQYRMTSTAGTFCYIDPEYQQTGMLGVKSDIYSLGIIFLQILTGKPPMGLTHHVERAIERGAFREMLDPSVPDWPLEEALEFAKLALKCSELRRKDRPDLGKVVLPYLNKLREQAEESLYNSSQSCTPLSPCYSQVSMSKDDMSYPPSTQSSIGG